MIRVNYATRFGKFHLSRLEMKSDEDGNKKKLLFDFQDLLTTFLKMSIGKPIGSPTPHISFHE
jgi:hypothetical protein